MQFWAISMLSASSELRVPSLREVERKSMIASARRCFVVVAACGFNILDLSSSGLQLDLPYCDGGVRAVDVWRCGGVEVCRGKRWKKLASHA